MDRPKVNLLPRRRLRGARTSRLAVPYNFSALIDDGHISEVRVAAGDGGRKTNQRKARMGDNITHFVNRCQMPGRSCWWVIPAPIATMAAVADRVIVEGDMTV